MLKKIVSLALGVVMSLSLLSTSVSAKEVTTSDIDLIQVVKVAKEAGMSDADITKVVEEAVAEFGIPGSEVALTFLNNQVQGFLSVDPYAVVLGATLAIAAPVVASYVWNHGGRDLLSKVPGLNRLVAAAPVPAEKRD